MVKYRSAPPDGDGSRMPHKPSQIEVEQPSLFSAKDLAGSYTVHRAPPIDLQADALIAWKQRVFDYQQAVDITPPQTQGSLFDLTSWGVNVTQPTIEIESLDPFQLPRQNTQFWRWKAEDAGVSSLYFVFDYSVPLLLYVGETVKSNQRWKGEHDCKRYLLHYQQCHYSHQLPTQLGITFWKDAPQDTRSRQKLESALIYKWRSPFNKENWQFWGTPFVSPA